MAREENVNGPRSEDVLQRFGYRQEIRRELKHFASFAAVFSFMSITTGIFTTYGSVLNWGGPLGVWTWPIVVLGVSISNLEFCLTGAGEKIASAEPIPSHFFCWDPFGNLLEFTMIQGNYPKAFETLCFTLQIAGKRPMNYSLPLSTYRART